MHWYAIHTKPHQERIAGQNLKKLGIETFCPQLKLNKVIRRKRQAVIRPLFPGYFFAHFNLDRHYRTVSYTQGVQKLVCFGPNPAVVDEEIIESIKSKLHEGYVMMQPSSFSPGQTVRIHEGPLQGLEAIFEQELSDHRRMVLLLRALSYQARVVVDLEQVMAG
jgi:transcriptional antiterminator RfaH